MDDCRYLHRPVSQHVLGILWSYREDATRLGIHHLRDRYFGDIRATLSRDAISLARHGQARASHTKVMAVQQ